MYKSVHGNARIPGSWRARPDGPRPDRMPQRDARRRVRPCYMTWFPGSRRRLRSRHAPGCAHRPSSLLPIQRFRAATRRAAARPVAKPVARRGDEVAHLASRDGRHRVRMRATIVFRKVRLPGFTPGSMPRALIRVGCGGALPGSGTLARTRRGRLFATGAAWRQRNAGNDLGLNARRRQESGQPGKSGRVEERELLPDSAVPGDPAVEPFP